MRSKPYTYCPECHQLIWCADHAAQPLKAKLDPRRRPTDSEILTWLVRHGYESGLCDPFTRSDVVKLMRAKRDGK